MGEEVLRKDLLVLGKENGLRASSVIIYDFLFCWFFSKKNKAIRLIGDEWFKCFSLEKAEKSLGCFFSKNRITKEIHYLEEKGFLEVKRVGSKKRTQLFFRIPVEKIYG